MIRFSTTLLSSVGKKIYMSVMGLFISGFLLIHLIGNLALLRPDRDPFNKYAHFLTHSLGNVIVAAEIILALIFIVHFVYGIIVTLDNWRARPIGYNMVTNAGHTSKKTIFSTTMIYTGLLILIFVVIHLRDLKYGEIITYTVDGREIRDLYALTVQFFGNIWNVLFYEVIMVLIGFHLAHGVWSAFQSLGINGPRFIKIIMVLGYIYAAVISIGFFIIPLWVYFTGGAA